MLSGAHGAGTRRTSRRSRRRAPTPSASPSSGPGWSPTRPASLTRRPLSGASELAELTSADACARATPPSMQHGRGDDWWPTCACRYGQIIDCIIAHGLEPMATLHHFVHPSWFEALGGFTKVRRPSRPWWQGARHSCEPLGRGAALATNETFLVRWLLAAARHRRRTSATLSATPWPSSSASAHASSSGPPSTSPRCALRARKRRTRLPCVLLLSALLKRRPAAAATPRRPRSAFRLWATSWGCGARARWPACGSAATCCSTCARCGPSPHP